MKFVGNSELAYLGGSGDVDILLRAMSNVFMSEKYGHLLSWKNYGKNYVLNRDEHGWILLRSDHFDFEDYWTMANEFMSHMTYLVETLAASKLSLSKINEKLSNHICIYCLLDFMKDNKYIAYLFAFLFYAQLYPIESRQHKIMQIINKILHISFYKEMAFDVGDEFLATLFKKDYYACAYEKNGNHYLHKNNNNFEHLGKLLLSLSIKSASKNVNKKNHFNPFEKLRDIIVFMPRSYTELEIQMTFNRFKYELKEKAETYELSNNNKILLICELIYYNANSYLKKSFNDLYFFWLNEWEIKKDMTIGHFHVSSEEKLSQLQEKFAYFLERLELTYYPLNMDYFDNSFFVENRIVEKRKFTFLLGKKYQRRILKPDMYLIISEIKLVSAMISYESENQVNLCVEKNLKKIKEKYFDFLEEKNLLHEDSYFYVSDELGSLFSFFLKETGKPKEQKQILLFQYNFSNNGTLDFDLTNTHPLDRFFIKSIKPLMTLIPIEENQPILRIGAGTTISITSNGLSSGTRKLIGISSGALTP